MPGRRGKQRVKRKKSKRQRPSGMERVLIESIHVRKHKERDILKHHIPPSVKPRVKKVSLDATLPMFNAVSKNANRSTSSVTMAKGTKSNGAVVGC
ncbi:hypothetical protein, conserved [Trypanosoma brucei gambiense DAL972]|uniref:Uncharacterized protein n=1 Tax=Trypanosoma brucei gambiense (strain MHOM/CI/86/DAL972) TaxID=679716 RepID=C9ZS75_TRYB9|nr:hypothetical protein, conserved [Trypanosoma brucei gambiense DAL972]XP_011774499.1 hypothetical protein, conserved [Trypanosoma brucei gambiense DAL972]CBH12211.1 hypothetical protein, conserved [Trypanosoma brucei gambiense DAL972]CBH12216.1 hypothetical protein, conserved [Trypanosoma brucei gambiense DAL972]|eukprot:XP_011774494.1 hypothetical protein, conserved [Trypanosoma brucei gambiense DAL972]